MGAKTVLAGVCDHKKVGEIWHVDPEEIQKIPGWNARRRFDTQEDEDLYLSIKEVGVRQPLKVRKDENKLYLTAGERRLRAALRVKIDDGIEIKVPVVVAKRGISEADMFFDDVCSNTGKPLEPVEEADAFKRALGWGFEIQEIALKTGRSVAHVRNRLELANASPAVKEAVEKKEIPIGTAQKIAKKNKSVEKQNKALEKKKSAPKVRKKQIFRIKDGEIKQTGYKDTVCESLKHLIDDADLIERIKEEGFDPETLQVSIDFANKLT